MKEYLKECLFLIICVLLMAAVAYAVPGSPPSTTVGTNAVGDTEMNYSEVTTSDFTDDAGHADRGTEGVTMVTFGDGDTTPDVSNGTFSVHRLFQTHQSTAAVITDFDDSDDHSEFSDGDWFDLVLNYGSTIDCSDNANIECNSNVDLVGMASQVLIIRFTYEGTQWKSNFNGGYSTPNTLLINKAATKAFVVSDADGIDLTDSDCGKYILMTGAGEVGMPDCDADLIGCFITVEARDAAEQIELVMFGDTTNDYFELESGSDLDANDEADLAMGENNRVCVMCNETNVWSIQEIKGDVTDGGVAD